MDTARVAGLIALAGLAILVVLRRVFGSVNIAVR